MSPKLFLAALIFLSSPLCGAAGILDEYPQLKAYTFTEPKSHFQLGLGIAPVSFLKSKVYSSFSVFQLHYVRDRIDFEVFNVSVGLTLTGGSDLQSRHFVVRTAPKWRLTEVLSIGPVLGLESVRFPNQKSRQFKAPWATKEESFSNYGMIYGLKVSETFKYQKEYYFKMNQVVYNQNYSVDKTDKDWEYFFADAGIDANRDPIRPGLVLMFEFSLLY